MRVKRSSMTEIQQTKDNKRQWNSRFIEYTEMIATHQNYQGLFFERMEEGRVKWVIAGKSEQGKKRRDWWDEQCRKHDIKIEPGCYAKVALKIHPTKTHICQICGKELSLRYVYPNKRVLNAIELNFGQKFAPFDKDIIQIINLLALSIPDIDKFRSIFRIKEKLHSKDELINYITEHFIDPQPKGALSPGAMSNSPDRFDGFHSDGACCRHESDKGRHQSNLQRYGQDRRAYENWADGDWKQADRLMSMFRKHGKSADHIGPISLGFCHRPKFHSVTARDNSSKNNRMTLSDVQVLLEDEKTVQVVSWHTKFIWDSLKNKVNSDQDAKKLSDLMRKNLHHVLIIFSMIKERGYDEFLQSFLNPEFSFFDYRFEGFDPETGTYKQVIQLPLKGKNQQNNIQRYYRVAFEVLEEYQSKENRRSVIWDNREVDEALANVFASLKSKQNTQAKKEIENVLILLAGLATKNW